MEQENERYELTIAEGVVWISDRGRAILRFEGADRLLAATGRLESLRLADSQGARTAGLERMLADAIKIEDRLCALLAEDAERLKRASALRTKLEEALKPLSATQSAQNGFLVGTATPASAEGHTDLLRPLSEEDWGRERGWRPMDWSADGDGNTHFIRPAVDI